MKTGLLIFFTLLLIPAVQAQLSAVTEEGETVILFEDGTWRYMDSSNYEQIEIPMNPIEYAKPTTSTFY